MRKAPLVSEDTWMDVKDIVRVEEERKRAAAGPVKEIQPELKEKLKDEVVSPYKQNWILVAILVVLALALVYNILPSDAPVIPIPDL